MSEANRISASIVSGSLAAFMPSVSPADREDILLVNLFAQRATRDEFTSGLNTNWFDNYRRKLSYLGWDATPPPNVRRRGPDRGRLVDHAVRQIEQAGSGVHAELTGQALTALENDSKAMQVFELNARVGRGLSFQLLPCVRHSGDYFDMVLYHMELNVPLDAKLQSLLFYNFNDKTQVRVQSAELIRFNLRIFRDEFKAKVQSRVTAQSRQSILDLKLR
ncbi:hypothetical protein ACNFG0_03165 [Pseudomonas sp. NY15372]|uniref:hypothetical protein n=1 Tax=Pseudomonas sp. NY15372 TaxID=3400356 RepID=UPI003A89394D